MKPYHHLSREERYLMIRLKATGISLTTVARCLGRDPSTISRELRRNRCTSDGGYRLEAAHSYAVARRRRVRRGSQFSDEQWGVVLSMLEQDWSPEQISGRIKRDHDWAISFPTIYRYVKRDRKAGGSLYTHLRQAHKKRRKRNGSADSRGRIAAKRHISERPADVESRNTFGHWEADTIIGGDLHHTLLTMVERKSGFAQIRTLRRRNARVTAQAMIAAVARYPGRFTTFTLDNGTEFHDYRRVEAATQVACYFATPYHSWERGTNENFNGLVRQYFPKRSSLAHLTQLDCDRLAYRLNTRPRKRFGYRTPQEVFYDSS